MIVLAILAVVGGTAFVIWLADFLMKKIGIDDDVRQVAGIILGFGLIGLMVESFTGR